MSLPGVTISQNTGEVACTNMVVRNSLTVGGAIKPRLKSEPIVIQGSLSISGSATAQSGMIGGEPDRSLTSGLLGSTIVFFESSGSQRSHFYQLDSTSGWRLGDIFPHPSTAHDNKKFFAKGKNPNTLVYAYFIYATGSTYDWAFVEHNYVTGDFTFVEIQKPLPASINQDEKWQLAYDSFNDQYLFAADDGANMQIGTVNISTGALTALGSAGSIAGDITGIIVTDANTAYVMNAGYIREVNTSTGAIGVENYWDAANSSFVWTGTLNPFFEAQRATNVIEMLTFCYDAANSRVYFLLRAEQTRWIAYSSLSDMHTGLAGTGVWTVTLLEHADSEHTNSIIWI